MTLYIKGRESTLKCIIPALDQCDWSKREFTITSGLSPLEKDKPWKT
jgi:hypothetical protein